MSIYTLYIIVYNRIYGDFQIVGSSRTGGNVWG